MRKILLLIILLIIAGLLSIQIDNAYKFSVIVLPDTQNYSKDNPKIFCDQIDWILKNKKRLNIVYVSHMGDIVDNGGLDIKQWDNASNCMKKLNKEIPYGILPGNHDSDIPHKKESGFKIYNKYFPAKDDNHYINNENNFETIKVLNNKILFLNLGIEPNDKELAWAKSVAEQNKDKYIILTTHKYLHDYDNELSQSNTYSKYGNSGQNIWNKLVYNNCNIKMIWSGHYHQKTGENKIVTKNSCGEDVNQIIQDYQGRENGGNGLLRIYTFSKDTIKVKTYSPFIDKYERDDNSQFELRFEY